MAKEYTFTYRGTKEDFFALLAVALNKPSVSLNGVYYVDGGNYIIEMRENGICFGVERGGHSGGYWYVPTITEGDGCIHFKGEIKYIGPSGKPNSKLKDAMEWIGAVLLGLLFLPVFLLFSICNLFVWFWKKISGVKTPKRKTTEQKLFDLMENHLHCVRE